MWVKQNGQFTGWMNVEGSSVLIILGFYGVMSTNDIYKDDLVLEHKINLLYLLLQRKKHPTMVSKMKG